MPSDDGRCNRTTHLFAALHGHTPIGRNHGVRHRHLEAVTSDVLTCTISEAQKFVAFVDTLPINGNMTIFITALQELLIDIAAHAARHGTDAITLETNNGVLCTQ